MKPVIRWTFLICGGFGLLILFVGILELMLRNADNETPEFEPARIPDRGPPEPDELDFDADYEWKPTAVEMGLDWLKAHQLESGFWSGDPASTAPDLEATSFALLAFLSHGETPSSAAYGPTVAKTIRALVENQDASGVFQPAGSDPAFSQAVAACAMAEAYVMTDNPLLKDPVIRGVRLIRADSFFTEALSAHREEEHTALRFWQIMALRSAGMSDAFNPEEGLVDENYIEAYTDTPIFPGWDQPDRNTENGEDPLFRYMAAWSTFFFRKDLKPYRESIPELTASQQPDGHWQSRPGYGRTVHTSLNVITLTLFHQRWYHHSCPVETEETDEGAVSFEI